MFLDGDTNTPTMVGTGAEDYFGTAWGMQRFINQNTGCTIADQKTLHWSCYRLHLPDPIYFTTTSASPSSRSVEAPWTKSRQMAAAGAPLQPISIDATTRFYPLFDMPQAPTLTDKDFPEGWTNYYTAATTGAPPPTSTSTPPPATSRPSRQSPTAPATSNVPCSKSIPLLEAAPSSQKRGTFRKRRFCSTHEQ